MEWTQAGAWTLKPRSCLLVFFAVFLFLASHAKAEGISAAQYGDGRAEIAAVTTPHIGGSLRIYRRNGNQLVEIAALAGFSNHILGKSELGLSAIVSVGGQWRMLVPDSTRSRLRLIAWDRGSIKVVAQCAIADLVTGPIQIVSPAVVLVGIASGQQRIVPGDCPAN